MVFRVGSANNGGVMTESVWVDNAVDPIASQYGRKQSCYFTSSGVKK